MDLQQASSGRRTLQKILFLEACMVSPIIIMCVCLLWLDLYTASIFAYNFISLALLPFIYMRVFGEGPVKNQLDYFLSKKLLNPSKQTLVGIALFSIVYIAIVINYDICEIYFRKEVIDAININFNKSYVNFALLVLLFGIINPFLEEFFWRNFIPVAFLDAISDSGSSSGTDDYRLQDKELDEENQETLFNKARQYIKHEELYKWVFAAHFASYHFFVVLHITNVLFAVIATIALIVAGRIFSLLNEKIGFITASLAHMGADIALCTLALVIFYNNKVL